MSKWLKVVSWLSLLVIILAVAANEYRKAKIVGNPYRYNIAVVKDTTSLVFVSFDPQEKKVFALTYPSNLEIKSRSVGVYTMANLYKLGTYDGEPALFVRRKMQGFMRVPIVGFLETDGKEGEMVKSLVKRALLKQIWRRTGDSTIGKLDSLVLFIRAQKYEWDEEGEAELIRANVIEKKGEVYVANQERLKQFLGTKVFDWEVGQHRTMVAIVNSSGEDGLASDIAEFMSNLGLDIVAVKSSPEKIESTVIEYKEKLPESMQLLGLLREFFGWEKSQSLTTNDYRADIVIRLGGDAIRLF